MSKRKSPGKKNPGRYIRESDLRNMQLKVAQDSFDMYAAVVLTVLLDEADIDLRVLSLGKEHTP